MRPEAVKDRFTSSLSEAGVEVNSPDLLPTWHVFRGFAAEPIVGTMGGLLFECGLHQYQNEGEFYVHFVRFFYHEGAAYMVDCNFEFGDASDLNGFRASIEAEGEEVPDAERCVAEVEAEREFWQAVANRRAGESTIYIGEQ